MSLPCRGLCNGHGKRTQSALVSSASGTWRVYWPQPVWGKHEKNTNVASVWSSSLGPGFETKYVIAISEKLPRFDCRCWSACLISKTSKLCLLSVSLGDAGDPYSTRL